MLNYNKILHQKYEQFWSNMAPKFSKDPWHYSSQTPYPSLLDFIKYCKKNSNGFKVLDIGSGNGRNSFAFAKAGFEVIGIDISPSAVKFAKNNIKKSKIRNIKFIEGDFLTYKFNKKYDIIIDSGLFHHLRKSQWPDYLNKFNNILNPRGLYYLLAFSAKTPLIKQLGKRQNHWSKRNNHYYRYFSRESLKNIFKNDFNLIKCYNEKRKGSKISFKISYLIKR